MTQDDLDALERDAGVRLDDLIRNLNADSARFSAEGSRLGAALQSTTRTNRAALASFRGWIDSLAPFQDVARHLQAAGRGSFAARLEATRADWTAAAQILSNMVQAGEATDRKIGGIMAEARGDTFGSLERMAVERRNAFDAANAAWLAGFRKR